MIPLVMLFLHVAGCLAKPSIGYAYSPYAPLTYSSYTPYQSQSLLTPYISKTTPSYIYNTPQIPLYQPPVSVVEPALGVKTQYHTQDGFGTTSYGHSEPQQSHSAIQDAHGNKIGSFSYVKPDGQVHRTDYVADADGYRVVSNDLPVGPNETPIVAQSIPLPDAPIIVESPAVPIETPEVIAARQAHFAAHAHAIHKRSIHSSYATPVVTPSGYLADTQEVAAAKVAHFAEHAKRGNYYTAPYANAVSAYYSPNTYHASYYTPVIASNGYLTDTEKFKISSHRNAISNTAYPYIDSYGNIADTPEVSAAKAAHFAEHEKAIARNSVVSDTVPTYAYNPHSSHYYSTPVITQTGHIADTPEVAQAKAAHLAEYAAVASRQKRSIPLGQTPASTLPFSSPVIYAAPYSHLSTYSYPYSSHPYSSYPYSSYPFLKSATQTTVVHGPHAVSYRIE